MTHDFAIYGADAMVRHGTWIYEVKTDNNRMVAIKNSWWDIDHDKKGEIVNKIL